MSALLRRAGGAAAAHPWRTLAAWLLILLAATALNAVAGGEPRDDYNVPGTPAQAGTEFLRERLPAASGADARVVVHHPDGGAVEPAVLAAVADRLARLPGVASVAPPRLSADGDTALLAVAYAVPVTDFRGTEGVDALAGAAAPARDAGLRVELGGSVPENFSAPGGVAEAVGIVAALLILVLALGSVVAAGLPLAVALVGLGVGAGLIGLLSAVTDISGTAPTVATMVGLGVGIDYALLLVARHTDGLRAGLAPVAAAAEATATAGHSVLVAGLTVLVSLFGLKLSTLPVYSSFGYATFATVGAVMLAAVTLVPALCALAGHRLLPRRARRARVAVRPPWIARWAARVARRPVPAAALSLGALLALAAPALDMRTWPQDAGLQPASTTVRRAYDLVAAEFGPGANLTMIVAADPAAADPVAVAAAVRAVPGVAAVTGPVTGPAGGAAVLVVEPATAPADERTAELVDRVRAAVPPGVHVTGPAATSADIADRLAERLWVVIGFVVALSVLLLTLLLRAPVVALKAAAMNLLSVAAAFGVVTVLFQTDAGARLIGLPHGGPVSSWVPVLMFTVLFGLSMDYEVFLLSRVREDWLATGDATGSVVRGLAATGRVITSAAAIMVAVFTGFALDPDVTVKTLGVGMATAVLIDATVVRLVLVPATMALLGRANWWVPGRRAAAPVQPEPDRIPAMVP
ncbi:MMPL family transporter [Spirilliplanes yamanashiensis]|uniref:MMPL family transporter n=1 Tax=Spirilliplanes yamanashiensis TaxID=42233 RepID=UPI00194FA96B|nr:MMPL family transporter [Spirilliplanes yamanashiensis]MDP9819081.1 RND superfamily putative drug exporter [Spirilliplanes yamanashiensis]